MGETVRFAVIGDCHYSGRGNYSTRDCFGAKEKLREIIDGLNCRELDFVFCLGDLGDGHDDFEVPEIMEVLGESRHPVKIAIGNHDLCRRGDVEHAELIGIPDCNYDFSVGACRFIVLDPFEKSRYSRNAEDKDFYWNWRRENAHVPVQEWPGLFRESTWAWLKSVLDASEHSAEEVVVFCHVPALELACLRLPGEAEPPARLVEYEKMLSLLDNYKNVRAYIAGHYHPGGLAVRNGVVHKTVRSVCDFKEPTASLFTLSGERTRIDGIGAETNFILDL